MIGMSSAVIGMIRLSESSESSRFEIACDMGMDSVLVRVEEVVEIPSATTFGVVYVGRV